MRRRTLLLAAAAGVAVTTLPVLATCSKSWFGKSAPKPPGPDAVPSAFAAQPTWPAARTTAESLTAARDRYLCGCATVSEARRIFTEGQCPIVVDVSGPTTRAVLLDKNGAWTTRKVEPEDPTDAPDSKKKEDDAKTALTTVMIGPALLDEEHAYLVLGTVDVSSMDPSDRRLSSSTSRETTCPVVMLKIRLSDGAVAASTTLSEQFPAENVGSIYLSFSADRNALLLTGAALWLGDSVDADYIGLRLSAEDLSVQLDAHAVLDSAHGTAMTPYGQAISAKGEGAPRETIVFLADGAQESVVANTPIMVRDGWYYYGEGDPQIDVLRCCARELASGRTVELDNGGVDEVAGSSWPRITSDQQEIIGLARDARGASALTVRPPGASVPALRWRVTATRAAVLGDVLYTTDNASSTHRLTLTSVSTGETIAETDETIADTEDKGSSGPFLDVVTPWGLVTRDGFYSATAWLDPAPAPADSSPPEPPSTTEPAEPSPSATGS